jgi:hypothetical protein
MDPVAGSNPRLLLPASPMVLNPLMVILAVVVVEIKVILPFTVIFPNNVWNEVEGVFAV